MVARRVRPMSVMASPILWLLILLLLRPAPARANQIWVSDTNNPADVTDFFDIADTIFATGDVDTKLDFFDIFPAADVYITTNRVWSTVMPLVDAMGSKDRVIGTTGGGGFFSKIIQTPPLPVGSYDLVVDENANGVFDGPDYVLGASTNPAFVVVPEPATLSLLALGSLIALRRRRR